MIDYIIIGGVIIGMIAVSIWVWRDMDKPFDY